MSTVDALAIEGDIKNAVRQVCNRFGNTYWRQVDNSRAYPEDFVNALAKEGWLSVLIPEEYGGGGLGINEACAVLEQINRCGGNSAACHAQMYVMGAVLRHGTREQKARYLPEIAAGRLRLQAFAVTEPDAGSDTSAITTAATKVDGGYRITGRKIFISRVQHSDLMLVLARTRGPKGLQRRTDGLTLFLLDLRTVGDDELQVTPIEMMVNHETNEVRFDNAFVPDEGVVGEVGRGFYQVLDGLNAERILLAAECVGDARWFIERSVDYARNRVVFGKPIGRNQGVQFPIAEAHVLTEAADHLRRHAASIFDHNEKCGAEANMAKFMASKASWTAANIAMDVYGGYGLAVEYDVERKFRENRLFQVAPVTNNLVLAYVAEHVLGLPRSA
ncbi:MAG: acyl-CoA/acyl-ACP dehydrogenase [Candidatus Dormibacteraeota bacterium]|uniref:Acyl-CoA/acyl-ACP dehydrogenase n=2 Tax=Candidatus Dormibacteria TaxID=3126996 RepID=A0A934K2A9_9BACT|nr:acyl-CoA/acyl-ACP dehydrogenase [Candidatus Dormibacteraeota bacterium]MBJ7603953.1 acyl-CoA/acyl-ACP dehydrogenase [Candidatus Dormibacteraeota bacterium]MBJ7607168.1 acyl-CoA/acyl-ACP dehydrogenase [Candidatus Dormibacteraeota bacterium]